MSGHVVHEVDVERAGDSVVVTLGKVTLVLEVADASALGLALIKVASSLAGDTLDEPLEGPP